MLSVEITGYTSKTLRFCHEDKGGKTRPYTERKDVSARLLKAVLRSGFVKTDTSRWGSTRTVVPFTPINKRKPLTADQLWLLAVLACEKEIQNRPSYIKAPTWAKLAKDGYIRSEGFGAYKLSAEAQQKTLPLLPQVRERLAGLEDLRQQRFDRMNQIENLFEKMLGKVYVDFVVYGADSYEIRLGETGLVSYKHPENQYIVSEAKLDDPLKLIAQVNDLMDRVARVQAAIAKLDGNDDTASE